jgi:hypothetical protein
MTKVIWIATILVDSEKNKWVLYTDDYGKRKEFGNWYTCWKEISSKYGKDTFQIFQLCIVNQLAPMKVI